MASKIFTMILDFKSISWEIHIKVSVLGSRKYLYYLLTVRNTNTVLCYKGERFHY